MLAFLLAASSLVVSEGPKVVVDEASLRKLQGDWQVTEQEHGGKKSDKKEIAKLTLQIAKSSFLTRDAGDVKEEAEVTALDAKEKPWGIDLKVTAGSDRGKVAKGIWRLDGDELRVCIAEPGRDRPKEFKGAEGSGHTLLVFRRVKK